MKVKASGMERMFGMSPNGIRLYEKQGVIRPQREESGYRTYGATELMAMGFGVQCRSSGFTLPQTAALMELVTAPAGTRCNLPGGWHGQRGWTHLHLLPPDGRHGRPEISLIALSYSPGPGDGRLSQSIPARLLSECTVRTRQPGDWIRPFGAGGRQTLQDYFVNRRVDAPFRDSVPLLCRGSEVLLAAGVGAGNVPPMNHTKDQLLLRWRGEMPWAQNDEGENRMERDAKLYADLSRVLVTREEIQQAVRELGRRITEDYAG